MFVLGAKWAVVGEIIVILSCHEAIASLLAVA